MSDVICNFQNICNEYYAVHALMLRPGDPLLPQSAYLFNLFDNDLPDTPGNALIRYRVLEHFHSETDVGALFEAYFTALGPGPRIAREVLGSFIAAGLLLPDMVIDPTTGNEIMRSVSVTCAGRRHFAITRNLWYGICVKTGMHIEPEFIKRGDEARQAAHDEVGIQNEALLEFYASHGWVSEKDFLEFISKQEALESRRIGDFQADHPAMLNQIGTLLEQRGSPSEILGELYGEQLYYWRRKGRAIK